MAKTKHPAPLDVKAAQTHLKLTPAMHLTASLGRKRYAGIVDNARMQHTILAAMMLVDRPLSMTDITAIAPISTEHNGSELRPALDTLLECGAMRVVRPGYGAIYEITGNGRCLHARLDRWARLEENSVLDVLGLL